MKGKLREKIIAISYNDKPLLRTSIFLLFGMLVLLFCLWKDSSEIGKILKFIIWLLSIIWILVLRATEAINKTKREITEKNKLSIVVLSSRVVWEYIILWVIISPVVILLEIKITFINVVMITVVALILILVLSKLFSDFFKKRLID